MLQCRGCENESEAAQHWFKKVWMEGWKEVMSTAGEASEVTRARARARAHESVKSAFRWIGRKGNISSTGLISDIKSQACVCVCVSILRTLSFLLALNFFRHSTVSCLCIMDATVERCCRETRTWAARNPRSQEAAALGRSCPWCWSAWQWQLFF